MKLATLREQALFHLARAADLLEQPVDHDLTVSEETAIRVARFHTTKALEALVNGADLREHPNGES